MDQISMHTLHWFFILNSPTTKTTEKCPLVLAKHENNVTLARQLKGLVSDKGNNNENISCLNKTLHKLHQSLCHNHLDETANSN